MNGKSYFYQHIDDLDKIAKQYREKHDIASARLETAKQKFDRVKADRTSSEDKRLIAQAELREAKAEHKRAMEEISTGIDREIGALRKNFETHMMEFFAARPEKVDQAAVSLMASGIMTASDLAVLANQHAGNPTMLRLIADHVQKMNEGRSAALMDRDAEAVRAKIVRFCSTKERMMVFASAEQVVRYSVDDRYGRAGVFQKEWDTKFYPSVKQQMIEMDSFSAMEG